MAWIASLRRRRIKQICRISTVDEVLMEELSNLPSAHLANIAKTAKRLEETDRWAFPLILTRLMKDPDSAQQLAGTPSGDLRDQVNHLVESGAREACRPAINEVSRALPPGCQVDEGKVLHATIGLIRDGTAVDQLCRSLTERLRSEPRTYVAGYADWVDQAARKIYESLSVVLMPLIPQGATPDEEKCVQAIRKMLEGKLSDEGVGTLFLEALRENPIRYICVPETWFQSQAGAAFAALQPALSRDLPDGCVLNRETCLNTLVELLKGGAFGNRLVDAFVEKVGQTPEYFVDGFSHFLDERAAEIFDQISSGLSEQVPPGFFKRDACVSLIRSLMRKGTKPDQLVERFVEEVKSVGSKYLRMEAAPFARSGAPYRSARRSPSGHVPEPQLGFGEGAKLFDRIDQQTSSQLPAGIEFNREACISLLENLVRQGTKPEKLVEEFFQSVSSMPKLYLRPK